MPAPVRSPLNPILAFIIGLAIILIASILNAAGLNLTKLDHVRTSAIPKSARKSDWMRPLWLLGMLLYILSQVLGSTLALEYMRAEYVAPLGSTSLVFNFLFARFLVGTPVTSTDIYGTIVVTLGVIGIVAFGSINSGLTSKTDVNYLTYLWRRPGWLGFFFCMSGTLLTLLVVTGRLDSLLAARGELEGEATPSPSVSTPIGVELPGRIKTGNNSAKKIGPIWWRYMKSLVFGTFSIIRGIIRGWKALMFWITGWLEVWTNPKDDKQIAWTLGIGWACCGGGLAGGCLVFAKAIVKLLSGSLSKQNPGNQFGHAAPIFTILLLAATAVLQILCLNRGLRVYDSTLVVPVFYGIYTATGFLNSLIFNDEVDAYKPWTLFLIFVSILVLISGVVLLTHKKPEPTGTAPLALSKTKSKKRKVNRKKVDEEEGDVESGGEGGEQEELWAVGEDSDSDDVKGMDSGDEDIDHHQHPIKLHHQPRGGMEDTGDTGNGKGKQKEKFVGWAARRDEESVGLMNKDDKDELIISESNDDGSSKSSGSTLDLKRIEPFRDNDTNEFGDWEGIR